MTAAVVDADDVRRVALSFTETVEEKARDMPTFRVAGKMFATLPDGRTSFAVRCPGHERTELIAAEPEKFWCRPMRPRRCSRRWSGTG